MVVAKKQKAKQKKRWYPITTGPIFKNATLGETSAIVPEVLVGRMMKVNMANVTGDVREQSTTLQFKIASATEGKPFAEFYGAKKADAAVKRMVRRNLNRIDSSFTLELGDGNKVRIKPMVLTTGRTSSSVLTVLKNTLERKLRAEAKKNKFDDFAQQILSRKLQSIMKSQLKKIYPIRAVEIRSFKIVGEKAIVSFKPEEAKPEAKAEAKPAPKEKTEKVEAPKEAPAPKVETGEE